MGDTEARADRREGGNGRLLDLLERTIEDREAQVRLVCEAYWRGYEDGEKKGLGDRWAGNTVYAGIVLVLLGAYLIVYLYQLVFR